MKTLLAGLLLGLVYTELAQSLRCYTCKEPTDIAECTKVTLCPPKATVCTTTLHSVDTGYPFFGNITVTRSCEEECISYNGIGASKPKSCCYTDFCTEDARSRNGVGRSSAALGLMTMVVGTFLHCTL